MLYATILYYLHNRQAVEQYLTDWIEHGERMRAEQYQHLSPARLRWQQLKTHPSTVPWRMNIKTGLNIYL
ncbi:MAG: hypothetical protein HC851_21265 [Acaryochloris sp. RU_4_1]|nr:hypothetical protein [Acaryochloris sp. RU_4_1]